MPFEPSAAYRSLRSQVEVRPGHPWYVPIVEADPGRDPILSLKKRILFEESESVHLLTGFRGNGKSTQLRRLQDLLEKEGCTVFRIDLLDWMLMSTPVELSDFLLSVVGALDEARSEEGYEPGSSLWDRLFEWLAADVRVEGLELEAGVGAAVLKTSLKTDPTFRERLQAHLRGRSARLVASAREFVSKIVDMIRASRRDDNHKVVLLVDSVEQLRGSADGATKVQNSAQELFVAQADNLRFPKLHVVYTFPPTLLPLAQNLGRMYGGTALAMWPNVHVRQKDGSADASGLKVLRDVVDARIEGREGFLSDAQLDELASCSGGDIRDFFRLIRECAVALDPKKSTAVDAATLKRVVGQLRSEFLPIAEADRAWLKKIHDHHDVALDTVEHIPTLVRFFDNNLILNYANGTAPWYDVHPLVLAELQAESG